jgi:hypothetical protein
VAGHHLIETYLTALARQLPAASVEELADGLTQTYQRHRSTGADPDTAAHAAITEFGSTELVIAAFLTHSPGRRLARTLLASGPLAGTCWGTTLLLGHAWTWPIPTSLRAGFGTALLTVIGLLTTAATTRRSYRRTRLAGPAALGLIGLDTAIVLTTALAAPTLTWPMTLAIPLSLTRIALTTRALPPLLTH